MFEGAHLSHMLEGAHLKILPNSMFGFAKKRGVITTFACFATTVRIASIKCAPSKSNVPPTNYHGSRGRKIIRPGTPHPPLWDKIPKSAEKKMLAPQYCHSSELFDFMKKGKYESGVIRNV